MSLHFSDESKAERECLPCKGKGRRRPRKERGARICTDCNGSGRIGVEGAVADFHTYRIQSGWCWGRLVSNKRRWGGSMLNGPFDTEDDAISAARAALTETNE